MIIRNNAHPRGIDVGPVQVWRPTLRPVVAGPGSRQGESYRDISNAISAANRAFRAEQAARRAARPKPEPILLHVRCHGCPTVFETYNPRRIWCTVACLHRHRRKLNHIPKSRKRPEVYASCGHSDKPMVAQGKCHACYMREWRAKRKAPALTGDLSAVA